MYAFYLEVQYCVPLLLIKLSRFIFSFFHVCVSSVLTELDPHNYRSVVRSLDRPQVVLLCP